MRRDVAASVTLGARHASAEVLDCRIEEIRTKKNAEGANWWVFITWKNIAFPLENSGCVIEADVLLIHIAKCIMTAPNKLAVRLTF